MTQFPSAGRIVGRSAAAVLLVVLVACGVLPLEAPQITDFVATPASIDEGSSSTLSWTIVGDAEVSLSDGTNPVTIPSGASSVAVSPTVTTTYALTATNAAGSVTEDVTVTVVPTPVPPQITSFVATPATIGPTDDATLSWSVDGADSVSLTDGTDPVAIPPGASSVVVSPSVTTTYTLTATNADGFVTADATVTVDPGVDLPSIDTFTATPSTIDEGDTSQLAWSVDGADSVSLSDGTDPVAIPPGASSVVVSPSVTTTYTLTATNADGSVTEDVTVTVVPAPAPELTGLTATIVSGSQVQLDWTVSNAVSVDVLTVANDDPTDDVDVASLAGSATTYTFDIPASTRQVVRVCARGAESAGDDCADAELTNVVVRGDDYDPYDIQGWVPEASIPGTFRAVLEAADPGSTIGFASDVDAIDLYGVALWPPGTGNNDAHVVLGKNITISGPPSGVTLTGRSGYDAGVDPDDGADPAGFTYRSRMVYVAPGVDVTLENLTITGGTFIYKGGGVRNEGTLTGTNVAITGNRAWDTGGGISNTATGDLTLVDSVVSNNRGVTEAFEVGSKYAIRDGFVICMFASGYGGGIFNEAGGAVTLVDTDVTSNTSVYSGGGIYNEPDGTVTVTGGLVSGNVADPYPITSDPVYPDLPWFTGDPDCSEVTSTSPPFVIGGGIYNGGSLQATGLDLLDNDVRGAGGGLFIDRNLQPTVLTTVLIQGNEAGVNNPPGFGGGILHEFFEDEGDDSNYTPSVVTFGTDNFVDGSTVSNYVQNPIAGGAPLFGLRSQPDGEVLPGRRVPRPGMTDR